MLTDADTSYLQQKEVAFLLDEMAKEILKYKPLDPRTHLLDWLEKKEQNEKKQLAEMRVEIAISDTKSVEIQPKGLYDMIRSHGKDGTLQVIDLREKQKGGRCPIANHYPYSALISSGFRSFEHKPNTTVVLVSARQKDGIAGEVAQVLCSRGDKDVCVLIGGWEWFLKEYQADPEMVVEYDPAIWK
eukprot:PhF_6_TR31352/c0_g1_i3/m.45873